MFRFLLALVALVRAVSSGAATTMTAVTSGSSIFFSHHADAACLLPAYRIRVPKLPSPDGTPLSINKCMNSATFGNLKFQCKVGNNKFTLLQFTYDTTDSTCASSPVKESTATRFTKIYQHEYICQASPNGGYRKLHCGEDSNSLLFLSPSIASPKLFKDPACAITPNVWRDASLGVCTPAYGKGGIITHNYMLAVTQRTSPLVVDVDKFLATDLTCSGRETNPNKGTIKYEVIPATAPAVPACISDPLHPAYFYENTPGAAPHLYTPAPTSLPTLAPTRPTFAPTARPSAVPSATPSAAPTQPSMLPTANPSTPPSPAPTPQPTPLPTAVPSVFPTQAPTPQPSALPTTPTASPTPVPSRPTAPPTTRPTTAPTYVSGSVYTFSTSRTITGPMGIALDASGTNLYVCEANSGPRRISLATGTVTNLASSTSFLNLYGIAVDSAGNVYTSEYSTTSTPSFGTGRIRKVAVTTEVVTTLLSGSTFHYPTGLAIDSSGTYLYVGNGLSPTFKITKITLATLASENIATSYAWKSPYGLAVDSSGNIFVADKDNAKIVRIDASTQATSFLATSITFVSPQGLSVDASGNVFVVENAGSIYKITQGWSLGGVASTLATATTWTSKSWVVTDAAGNVYISEIGSNRIRVIAA